MASLQSPPSPKTRVKRFHERGVYDAVAIGEILDAGLLCHVAFEFDGPPAVIPTFYWRDENALYFHGSAASRMIRAIEGKPVCISVTLLDGLIFTRSAFHHSANYRSVVVYGAARHIESPAEKERQLRLMMEKLSPGRWKTLRPVKPQELNAVQVMSVSLDEASAKVRAGPPSEDESDLAWNAWAGVVPIETIARAAAPDAHCDLSLDPPELPAGFKREDP